MEIKKQSGARTLTVLRILILAAAAVLIAIGAAGGELAIVFEKAVTVCLECIGIG